MKGASLRQALALPADIRLRWNGLPGTNTLAYYENEVITNEKVIKHCPSTMKLFTAVIIPYRSKLSVGQYRTVVS